MKSKLRLSTPFGIKEDRTSSAIFACASSKVCSTPFGIKEDRTLLHSHPKATGRFVLNAFRHQRGSHSRDVMWPVVDAITCSTPFGIKEDRTKLPTASTRTPSCAQRLSASKRIAPPARAEIGQGGNVLNAFRHQRGSHRWTRAYSTPLTASAQRLSASKRIAQYPCNYLFFKDKYPCMSCTTPNLLYVSISLHLSTQKMLIFLVLTSDKHLTVACSYLTRWNYL